MILIPISTEKITIVSVSCTSCTHTKSNLYFAISFATDVDEPALERLLTSHVPNLMFIFLCLGYSKEFISVQSHKTFQNKLLFYGIEFLAQPQTGGPHTVGCPQLLIQYIFAADLHLQPEDVTSCGDKGPT
jgi:hypothetical protein